MISLIICKESEVSQKPKQDPVTGLVHQSLIRVVLGGAFVFAILIVMITIFPYYLGYYLYISIPIGILGFISLIWINIRPNLYSRFILNLCISILSLIIAIRAFDNLLPGISFYGAVLIVALATSAHVLPIWNPKLARFIRDELSAPRTKFGKAIFRASLALLPFIGIFCAMITSTLNRENKSAALSVLLLSLGLIVATILPFAYRFPSSPWETKN